MGLTRAIIAHEMEGWGVVTTPAETLQGQQVGKKQRVKLPSAKAAPVSTMRADTQEFEEVRLFVDATYALKDGIVYLADDEHLPPSELLSDYAFIVMHRPGTKPDEHAAIAIETDLSREAILIRLQDVFMRYRSWEQSMDRSCIANEGLKRLLDISENYTVNHIAIIDSTLKLIGATRGIPCDDGITVELMAHGYHTETNIRKFHKHDYLRIWNTFDDFIVDDTLLVCPYSTVIYSFKQHDAFSMLVVMMCNRAEPAQWLVDVYKMLIKRVTFYFDKDYPSGKPSGSAVSDFIVDLINNEAGDRAAVIERSKYVGIAFESDYCLFVISADLSSPPFYHLLVDVVNTVAPAQALIWESSVVILCSNCRDSRCLRKCLYGTCDCKGMSIAPRLEKLLGFYNLTCGRSAPFSDLMHLRTALGQAVEADKIGAHISNGTSTLLGSSHFRRIFSFDRYCIEYLANYSYDDCSELLSNTFGSVILGNIAKYDEQHGTDYYRFLYYYLLHERHTQEVAHVMHMHRNSIKHRIDRMYELFDLDLANENLRLELLFAYRMREVSIVRNAQ